MAGATGCQSPAVVAAEYKGELHVSWGIMAIHFADSRRSEGMP